MCSALSSIKAMNEDFFLFTARQSSRLRFTFFSSGPKNRISCIAVQHIPTYGKVTIHTNFTGISRSKEKP